MNNPLIGVWRLVSWVLINVEGTEFFPYGADAQGCLIYTDHETMSVHLMKSARSLIQQNTVFDILPKEAVECFQSYASYCGTYQVFPDKVQHKIHMHINPNWINTIQERYYKLDDNLLCLSHTLEQWDSKLVWRKD